MSLVQGKNTGLAGQQVSFFYDVIGMHAYSGYRMH